MNARLNLALLISIGLFGGVVLQQYSPSRIYAQNQTPIRIETQTPGGNNGVGGGVFRVGGGVSSPLMLQKVEGGRPWPNAYIDLAAEQMERDGPLVHLKGHAEIRTQAVVVRGDEADFNQDSLEVEVRGNVHIRLLKAK